MRRLAALALLVTGSFIPAGLAAQGSQEPPANATYAVQPGDVVSFGCTSALGESGTSAFTLTDATGTKHWPAANTEESGSVRLTGSDSSIGWHRFIRIAEPGVFTGTWSGPRSCSVTVE